MSQRETSYWLFVSIGGPVAGFAAGIFWWVWMGLFMGPTLAHWIIPGAFFGGTMMIASTCLYAFSLRTVRREWRVAGDAAARQRLLAEAVRMKYRPLSEEGNYLVLRSARFAIKPLCSNIEVWLTNDSLVIDGPYAVVNKLAKRLGKS